MLTRIAHTTARRLGNASGAATARAVPSAQGSGGARGYHVGSLAINSPARRTSINAPRRHVYEQRRRIHVGFQGSGVEQSASSSVTSTGAAYQGTSHLIGGPGASQHSFVERFFGGALQTDEGQKERLDDAKRHLVKAYREGDDRVHISSHSRGAGNALLLAQELHEKGLVCPDSGEQVRPPGVPVHSFTVFDSVPHMGDGRMNVRDGEGGQANVEYEDPRASLPGNVQHAQHYLAGGDKRAPFRQANMPPASAETASSHIIVPNATHKDVGGNPKGNPDAIGVVASEAVRNLHGAFPEEFSAAQVLPAEEHNRKLERLQETEPAPGFMERMLGYFLPHERTFPDHAKPMARRGEKDNRE
ncbi:MAG TPA: hypothetical protein VF662_12035 [Allosphingosinicella sp.]|jgi:hypothetical protein